MGAAVTDWNGRSVAWHHDHGGCYLHQLEATGSNSSTRWPRRLHDRSGALHAVLDGVV